jgi:hypothetical protein
MSKLAFTWSKSKNDVVEKIRIGTEKGRRMNRVVKSSEMSHWEISGNGVNFIE